MKRRSNAEPIGEGLLDAATALHAAKRAMGEAWRRSLFRKLLIANLESERLRIVEPPKWYGDKLALLIGHGVAPVDLKYAVIYAYDESVMNVNIVVTYVDPESDETKLQAYDIHPPTELFRRTTKVAFARWARTERNTNLTRLRKDLQDELDRVPKPSNGKEE